jgi:HD-like signal output (HDOD) protein
MGVIAQQVTLMNSLVKPQNSDFHMHRFWAHSLGTALIADKLYTDELVPLRAKIEFNDYWMGALLHDIGKLVMGFFFGDHFGKILSQASKTGSSFRDAENVLSDPVNHEYLGGLLMLNANGGPNLVKSVATHHYPGKAPRPLVCLVHLANNLCKDLGLGYLPEEQGVYSPDVLESLKLKPADMQEVKEKIGPYITSELADMVSRCTQA